MFDVANFEGHGGDIHKAHNNVRASDSVSGIGGRVGNGGLSTLQASDSVSGIESGLRGSAGRRNGGL